MPRILIVNSDKKACQVTAELLCADHYTVHTTHSAAEALKLLQLENYDLVLCGAKTPDETAIEFLREVKTFNVAFIMMADHSDIRTVSEVFRCGIDDYMIKPFDRAELLSSVKEIISRNQSNPNVRKNGFKWSAEKQKNGLYSSEFLIGKSIQSQEIQHSIELVAPTDISVIIEGETGTGKEFVAHSIHKFSKRCMLPFIAIDCGALPDELAGSELFGHVKGAFTGAVEDKKGCFEVARGGTIFLDEIGNLVHENQVKLLRVLQERTVKRLGSTKDIAIDVRIIAATNKNLSKAVKEGNLRRDLYHRLNEFKIELTPLRERKDDVMFFAEYFLKKSNQILNKRVTKFSDEVKEYLSNYPWPGNLRELNNVIKRAVLLTTNGTVECNNLTHEIIEKSYRNDNIQHQDESLLRSISEAAERELILDMLGKTSNNKAKASQLMNIGRRTLYNKLRLYDIVV